MSHREFVCELVIDGVDPGVFRLAEFTVTETLFQGYQIAMSAFSKEEVEAPRILGKSAALTIRTDQSTVRKLHGLVLRASSRIVREELFNLQVEIGARIELLKLGKSSRIFQNLSVPEVVKKILDETQLGGDAQIWKTKTSYPKREYIVQPDECDFDFIARILSEEGIGLAINNSDEQDQIVFFDDSTSLEAIFGDSTLPHRDSTLLKEDTVIEISECSVASSDAAMVRDYDFKRPAVDLSSREETPKSTGREAYFHPGDFTQAEVGKRRAKRLLERLRAQARIFRGRTDCPRLEVGRTFQVESHPRSALNIDYLLISVSHRGNVPGEEQRGAINYENEFVAIPKQVPYRPASVAAPERGTEVAFVTCPSGEEIHADDFGRVKVRFPWDRSGTKDDRSSRWLRVGQVPMGGSMVLPRGDFEVTVDYELGDINRPFVSGHLYNGEKAPPYQLPAGKTRSSLQTATTAGGPGANELRFEDAAGGEEIFFNASKDLTVSIENDQSTKIVNDQVQQIGANHEVRIGAGHTASVGSNRTVAVGASQTVNVGGDFSDTVGGSEAVKIGGVRKLKVGGDHSENSAGSLDRSVALLQSVTSIRGYQRSIVGASSVQVGAAWLEVMARNRASVAGGARKETVGAAKIVKAKDLAVTCGAALVTNGAAEVVDAKGSRTDSADGPLAITAGAGLSVKASNITLQAENKLVLIAGACTVKLSSDGTVEVSGPKLDLAGVEDLSQAIHESN